MQTRTCETTPSHLLEKSLTSMQFVAEFPVSLEGEFSLPTPERNHNSFHTRRAWNKVMDLELCARRLWRLVEWAKIFHTFGPSYQMVLRCVRINGSGHVAHTNNLSFK